MSWKDKFCGTCFYQVENRCRRFPPNDDGYYTNVLWIKSGIGTVENPYLSIPMPACGEYKENEQEN